MKFDSVLELNSYSVRLAANIFIASQFNTFTEVEASKITTRSITANGGQRPEK